MVLIDFNEIPAEGERWMQFARDFMQNLGFHVELPSYRGAENAFDLYATEQIRGTFNLQPFRWLVSCRHKAATRTAVKESEEIDILERVLRCKADGFIGFYSTPASSALNLHLSELKKNGHLKDYRLFDAKCIESYLVTPAFSRIATRFFPNYAQTHRIVHLFQDAYFPVRCGHCDKDLLESLLQENHQGVVVRLRRRREESDELEVISEVYFACKGSCDERLQAKYCTGNLLSAAAWANIADLIMPPVFLERVAALIDQLGKDQTIFSPQALAKEDYLIRALAQVVLRESSKEEKLKAQTILAK